MIDQRLKIAVFIDFDNIEIGVKTTLHMPFDIAAILEGIKERGEVVTKVAYGDWKRAGDYGRLLSQHAIRMVQRNLTPGGDKNGADINLALDALEMAFTHDHINAFVIVGGDSDFITLVEKLKQYDKKVFVVGGRQFTSQVMQKNCHEFIAYENLVGGRRPAAAGPRRDNAAPAPAADLNKAIPLVRRALKVLADREVSPQLGLLKSTLLQLDSTFSERDYGAGTFRDFIEKVAKTGIITLRHAGRSTLVDAVDGALEGGDAVMPPVAPSEVAAAPAAPAAPVSAAAPPVPPAAPAQSSAAQTRDPEQVQQLIAHTRDLLARAPQPPRWPMYVRQLKQHLRSADPTFEERKWGFATIMEFLRTCQREGLFRLERDRRGQIRVFPGSTLQPAETTPLREPAERDQQGPVFAEPVMEAEPFDATAPGMASEDAEGTSSEVTSGEPIQVEPVPSEIIEVPETDLPARARRPRRTAASGRPARKGRSGKPTRRRKAPAA